jgi:hypothetical protein
MTKRNNRKATIVATNTIDEEIMQLEAATTPWSDKEWDEAHEANQAVDEAIEQHEADETKRGKSVVPLGYKKTYAQRAVAAGRTTKAAKRSNGDWLAQELEAECVRDGHKFDLSRFLAILEANGIGNALERWPNRNNGWEGRLRMSGAIVLRGIVCRAGIFRTPENETRLADDPNAAAMLTKWDGRNG